MKNKFNFGDIVSVKEFGIDKGIVIGITFVPSDNISFETIFDNGDYDYTVLYFKKLTPNRTEQVEEVFGEWWLDLYVDEMKGDI